MKKKPENKKQEFKPRVIHVVSRGNRKVIRASREAIGAMKYKSE